MVKPEKLQEYIDKAEIKESLARYSICVDTGDTHGFAALFTEDGLWEWEAAGLQFCGHSQLRRVAEVVHSHAKGSQHAVSNPVVEIDGDNARSICQLTCFLSKPEKIYSLMIGYYEDEWVNVDGKWRISRRVVRVENPEILTQGKIAEYFQPLAEELTDFMQADS